MRSLPVIAVLLLFAAGCSEPPQKEIDQAQAAIDSARAAGADTYAADEYAAATSALQKAHASVDQRDYRQALSYAIDARQRAADAVRQIADGRLRARRTADALITDCSARVSQLRTRVSVAEAARIAPKDLRAPRSTVSGAQKTLQETRVLMGRGNYQEVVDALTGVRKKLDAAMKQIDGIPPRPPRRKR